MNQDGGNKENCEEQNYVFRFYIMTTLLFPDLTWACKKSIEICIKFKILISNFHFMTKKEWPADKN